jgi:hypothetical protein
MRRREQKIGELRALAEEVVRRAQAAQPDGVLPDVLRLSDPPTPEEQLQMIACHLLGKAVAIMPGKALTIDEWIEEYAPRQA